MLPMRPQRTAASVLAVLAVSLVACDPNLPEETPEQPEPTRIAHPIDPGGENESRNLLQAYATRPRIDPGEAAGWQLPFQAKRVAVGMLIAAARDRPEDLHLVLTPDATWGLPDRRRIGERPIFDGDGGEKFLAALRNAAQRFPLQASWTSQPVLPGVQDMYRTGAEPMWTYWSQDQDHIVTRMTVIEGTVRIDYVGLWEDGPDPSMDTSNWGMPPPFIPPVRRERIALPDGLPSGGPPPD